MTRELGLEGAKELGKGGGSRGTKANALGWKRMGTRYPKRPVGLQ